MNQHEVEEEYFGWLYEMVTGRRFAKCISYRKLMRYLHDTPFRWSIPKDRNRAEDGIGLRRRYALYSGFEGDYFDVYLDRPCSVLEMMIALAIRCEETIMDDPLKGDRTGQWFWGMLTSLGLASMNNNAFDIEYVEAVIQRFLDRDYRPDGVGGLFTVRGCRFDLRETEIWIQMLWFLDTIA